MWWAEYLSGSQDQKAKQETKYKVAITDITNQNFRKLLKGFKNSPYLCYKKKHVNYESSEAYFFLIIKVIS